MKLQQLDNCKEWNSVVEKEVTTLNSIVETMKGQQRGYEAELNIRSKQLESANRKVTMYRNRSRLTVIGSAILVGLITFIAIK